MVKLTNADYAELVRERDRCSVERAALAAEMARIEKQTRGYDSMSTMGILNEIANKALAAGGGL